VEFQKNIEIVEKCKNHHVVSVTGSQTLLILTVFSNLIDLFLISFLAFSSLQTFINTLEESNRETGKSKKEIPESWKNYGWNRKIGI
jgi:hypothetical protein